jgi:lycopene beta-cyclase
MIMDATVDQAQGYRFVYRPAVRPDRLFVEDTYYARRRDLDVRANAGSLDLCLRRAAGESWRIEREEPPRFRSRWAAISMLVAADAAGCRQVGMASGLFQPMTGYSLPDAVRTASLVAGLADLSSPGVGDALRPHAEKAWKRAAIIACSPGCCSARPHPAERYRMLERFYRLDSKSGSRVSMPGVRRWRTSCAS